MTVDETLHPVHTAAAPLPSQPGQRIDVRGSFPGIRRVVSIAGAASNSGKTFLCEEVLRGCAQMGLPTLALKVTRTHVGGCPRGVDTCGTCDSLTSDYRIVRDLETLRVPGKDTGRYFEAGATHVLWLLVNPASMRDALLAVLADVPQGAILVAEGNSFRDYAAADVALMALGVRGELKPSARTIVDRIDAFVLDSRSQNAPAAASVAHHQRPLIRPENAWSFVRDRIL